MKRSALCSTASCAIPSLVLGGSRPLFGVDNESSEVVQETLHPLFFLPPQAARAPHDQTTTSCSPNITHFGSLLVFSIRVTNPLDMIRLLRIIVSMLSLDVFIRVSADRKSGAYCRPAKSTRYTWHGGGQSRLWSAEQGKENKKGQFGSATARPPPPPPPAAGTWYMVQRKCSIVILIALHCLFHCCCTAC